MFFCFAECYNGTNREDGEPGDPTDSQSHHGEQNRGRSTAFACDAVYRRVLCALSLVRGFGHGGRNGCAEDAQREQDRGTIGQCGGCAVSGGLRDSAGAGNPVSGLDVGLDCPDCGGKSGPASVVCRARKTTAGSAHRSEQNYGISDLFDSAGDADSAGDWSGIHCGGSGDCGCGSGCGCSGNRA